MTEKRMDDRRVAWAEAWRFLPVELEWVWRRLQVWSISQKRATPRKNPKCDRFLGTSESVESIARELRPLFDPLSEIPSSSRAVPTALFFLLRPG